MYIKLQIDSHWCYYKTEYLLSWRKKKNSLRYKIPQKWTTVRSYKVLAFVFQLRMLCLPSFTPFPFPSSIMFQGNISSSFFFPLCIYSGWFQELKGKMLSYSVSLCQNFIFISLFPLNRLFRESRGNKPTPGWQLCLAWSRKWKQRWMAHLTMPNTISGVQSLLLSPAVQVIFYIFIKMIYFSFYYKIPTY